MKYYSLEDIHFAKEVMSTCLQQIDKLKKSAQRILRWHETYLKFVRLMHKHVKDWSLSTLAVWKMIRQTKKKSIFSLYKSFVHSLLKPKAWSTSETYVKGSFTETMHGKRVNVKLSQKCRAEKSRFRMRCMNITNNMQII